MCKNICHSCETKCQNINGKTLNQNLCQSNVFVYVRANVRVSACLYVRKRARSWRTYASPYGQHYAHLQTVRQHIVSLSIRTNATQNECQPLRVYVRTCANIFVKVGQIPEHATCPSGMMSEHLEPANGASLSRVPVYMSKQASKWVPAYIYTCVRLKIVNYIHTITSTQFFPISQNICQDQRCSKMFEV